MYGISADFTLSLSIVFIWRNSCHINICSSARICMRLFDVLAKHVST